MQSYRETRKGRENLHKTWRESRRCLLAMFTIKYLACSRQVSVYFLSPSYTLCFLIHVFTVPWLVLRRFLGLLHRRASLPSFLEGFNVWSSFWCCHKSMWLLNLFATTLCIGANGPLNYNLFISQHKVCPLWTPISKCFVQKAMPSRWWHRCFSTSVPLQEANQQLRVEKTLPG